MQCYAIYTKLTPQSNNSNSHTIPQDNVESAGDPETAFPVSKFNPAHQPFGWTVRITTNVGTPEMCYFLPVSVPPSKSSKDTPMSKAIFGSLLFNQMRLFLLNRRPWNHPLCPRRGRTSAQFTYYAPSWALSRALYFMAVRMKLLESVPIFQSKCFEWFQING
jgi:hypothetical protein